MGFKKIGNKIGFAADCYDIPTLTEINRRNSHTREYQL